MQKFTLLFLAIIALIFFSCNKFGDLEDLSLDNADREFAVPIGSADFTLSELIESFGDRANIFVDSDNTIRLNYRANLPITTNADGVFEAIQRTLTGGNTGLDSFPVLDTHIALPFGSPEGVDIDFMHLRRGDLKFNVINDQTEPVTVKFEFPEVLKDGESLKREFDLAPFAQKIEVIDLSEYLLQPKNDSIYFSYSATTLTGDQVTLNPFLFWMSINNIEFSYAEGYFGQVVHEGAPDSIVIDFFDEWTNGDVFFEDPKISFYSRNSFGVPTQAVINSFDVETINLGRVPLESPYINDPDSLPKFGYPTLPDQVGMTISDTFTFHKNNSNIEDVLGAGPKKIFFDVDAITNPDSNTAIRGFITEDSEYFFEVEADLPLHGKTNGFAASDELDWNFADSTSIKHAEFKIIADNELGLEIRIQGYFTDASGRVLDSLFTEKLPIIEAAPVDALGYASGTQTTVTFASFTAERFEKIKSADKLILNADFYSPEDGIKSVRIESEQKLNVRMGLKFGL